MRFTLYPRPFSTTTQRPQGRIPCRLYAIISEVILQKILILKLCCLGDLMQMLPMLGAVRKKYPKAQIDFLASSWIYEVLARLPDIDRILVWDEPYRAVSWRGKLVSALQTARMLRGQGYDAAFIAHRSPLFGSLARMAGISKVIGFGSKPFLCGDTLGFNSLSLLNCH